MRIGGPLRSVEVIAILSIFASLQDRGIRHSGSPRKSGTEVSRVGVCVKAPARFDAQPALVDIVPFEFVGKLLGARVARYLGLALHYMPDGVQPHMVVQPERSAGHAEVKHDRPVHVLHGRDLFHQSDFDRHVVHGAENGVRHVAGELSLENQRHLLDSSGEGRQELHDFRGRPGVRHDVDQLVVEHAVEVQRGEPGRPARGLGVHGRQQRRRVGGEDRFGMADLVELGKDLRFEVGVLEHGLAQQVRVGPVLGPGGVADPGQGGLGRPRASSSVWQ